MFPILQGKFTYSESFIVCISSSLRQALDMPDYPTLRELLQLRLKIIADTDMRENQPEKQLQQLQDTSEKITAWQVENRSEIPAQLNHFLKQSSLTKALEYIESL